MGDISARLKKENVLAQTVKCGFCSNPLTQGGSYKEYDIKGYTWGDGDKATGFLCEDCQKFPERIKEGPKRAVREDAAGNVQQIEISGLLAESLADESDELVVTANNTLARRDKATGKLKKLEKDEQAEVSMMGTTVAHTTPITTAETEPETRRTRR